MKAQPSQTLKSKSPFENTFSRTQIPYNAKPPHSVGRSHLVYPSIYLPTPLCLQVVPLDPLAFFPVSPVLLNFIGLVCRVCSTAPFLAL